MAFSTVFFCIQQFQHTDLIFSLLYFAFVVLTVLTFNLAEGFKRMTGAYTFWFSTLIVMCGVSWKAVVGEPADSNLMSPLLDMALYTGSIAMLFIVTLLNKKVDVRRFGIGGGFTGPNLDLSVAGLGCIVTGLAINFDGLVLGAGAGGLASALGQINFFLPLGIILTTAGALKDSGGRRSTSPLNLLIIAYVFWQGLVVFSKQGMLTPILCWILGALYMRMKVRPIHVVFMISFVLLTYSFIGPLSESRDLIQDQPFSDRPAIIWYQVTHWKQFKNHVANLDVGAGHDEGGPSYYNQSAGAFIDRLSMMVPDDRLNTYSARGNFTGMAPIIEWFGNMVPRFLYPSKTNDYTGNYFAHKAGGYIGADDTTTGISFSPVSCAYTCEGWGGILWLMPMIWILLFTTVDFMVGDLTKYPWGLLVIVWFGHATPESLLSGMIYYISYGNLGMLLAIIVCTRIAPIIGSLFSGRAVAMRVQPVGLRRITPRVAATVAAPSGPMSS
jgi:hypothetical protein